MFEIDNSIISSEELTARVRRRVLEKNIPMPKNSLLGDFALANSNLAQIQNELVMLRDSVNELNTLWVISEPTIYSSRRVIGPVIVFTKKVIRKCLRWLLRPYFDQVTQFNGAATRAISDTLRIQEMLISQIQNMSVEEK